MLSEFDQNLVMGVEVDSIGSWEPDSPDTFVIELGMLDGSIRSVYMDVSVLNELVRDANSFLTRRGLL